MWKSCGGVIILKLACYQCGARPAMLAKAWLAAIVFSYVRFELSLNPGSIFLWLSNSRRRDIWVSMGIWGLICLEYCYLLRRIIMFAVSTVAITLAFTVGVSKAFLLNTKVGILVVGSRDIWVNATSQSIWPIRQLPPPQRLLGVTIYSSSPSRKLYKQMLKQESIRGSNTILPSRLPRFKKEIMHMLRTRHNNHLARHTRRSQRLPECLRHTARHDFILAAMHNARGRFVYSFPHLSQWADGRNLVWCWLEILVLVRRHSAQ